jgi:fructose-bisphosphate aldolase class 1
MLEGMILKPNMVLPGLTCPKQETVDEVADASALSLAGRAGGSSMHRVLVGRSIR